MDRTERRTAAQAILIVLVLLAGLAIIFGCDDPEGNEAGLR